MMVRAGDGGDRMSMSIGSHDEFLELCALAASGELSPRQQKKLSDHLAVCSSCREAQQQFASLVAGPISELAAENKATQADPSPRDDASWSIETAEAEFFERLAQERNREPIEEQGRLQTSDREGDGQSGLEVPLEKFAQRSLQLAMTWRELWISYAATILLVVSLSFAAYRVGIRRNVISIKPDVTAVADIKTEKLEEQISDLSHDREIAQAGMAQRDRLIADLKHQLQQQSAELAQLKTTENELQEQATVRKRGQDSTISQRQVELEQKLQQAQSDAQSLRSRLETVEQKSAEDNTRAANLQARVDDLTHALQDKGAEVAQQQDLLAHDRDIRDLMGARDLYIAEVYDVVRSGETQKAFGRLFYTKEKSLIFYAYDLDREPGIKNASAFQAWGRRGPDWSKALNLGIFYEDNAAKKRWVLKFSDPKSLAQVDAVFVTIEPQGGSRKPSGQPLLFAYLKMDANHP